MHHCDRKSLEQNCLSNQPKNSQVTNYFQNHPRSTQCSKATKRFQTPVKVSRALHRYARGALHPPLSPRSDSRADMLHRNSPGCLSRVVLVLPCTLDTASACWLRFRASSSCTRLGSEYSGGESRDSGRSRVMGIGDLLAIGWENCVFTFEE